MLGLGKVAKKFFGSRNERVLHQCGKVVVNINLLESDVQALSDEQLQAKTQEFKERHKNGESLDRLLPEAFAVVREASVRTLGLRHFDVQLIGGMILHDGKIAEMGTGEGKTLVGTLPAYLNAISGLGVHIVTVNDYLAKRDAEWMQPVYNFLGLSLGVVVPDMSPEEKRAAYNADIVYGTNNEFGFDYLRDNMAFDIEHRVQRELNFAIVDEVDSILIDEARTPLIISGSAEESSEAYVTINKLIPELTKQEEEDGPGDYTVDEKLRQTYLTDEGHQHIEELLEKVGLLQPGQSLYDAANITLMHYVNSSLRAHALYSRDVDYIVRDDQVVIVDEHTGRTMPGRRWSEGLHQAIEAKEGVSIQGENQTLATITFQNFFRLYNTLSGMTGTADTEAYEFHQIYGLEVTVIPTNKPSQRADESDLIYLTAKEKYEAIVEDIQDCREKNQPVLVGTASIENSEILSNLMNKKKIPHQVLNAKFHAKEAEIITEAGRPGMITIATNMAGRGTDIVLGGSLEAVLHALGDEASDAQKEKAKQDWQQRHETVLAAGGLRVIGSERHESRRIDNQLRGRCGRQGDPGSTQFYLSLEDDLMRIFASERMAGIMQRLGVEEGEAIQHSLVTKAIENAQKKVEGRNFDIRKELLEYDDVANDQRKVVYEQRRELMAASDISQIISNIRYDVVNQTINEYIPAESLEEQWEVPGLEKHLDNDFGLRLNLQKMLNEDENLHEETLREFILDEMNEAYHKRANSVAEDAIRQIEKSVTLQTLDSHWREHLATMDHLRQSIHLRGYAQRNPKQEYKREAFNLFSSLLDSMKHDVIATLSRLEVQAEEDAEAVEEQRRQAAMAHNMQFQHASMQAMTPPEMAAPEEAQQEAAHVPETPFVREEAKVGRNAPCPCGSGKKYKQCHGKLQ